MAETILSATFHATGNAYIFSSKTDYDRHIVGLSVNSTGTDSSNVTSVNIVSVGTPTTYIYGTSSYRAFMKSGSGGVFNLPMSVDSPYVTIGEDFSCYIGSAQPPISGVIYWYEEFVGEVTGAPQLSLMGVGT